MEVLLEMKHAEYLIGTRESLVQEPKHNEQPFMINLRPDTCSNELERKSCMGEVGSHYRQKKSHYIRPPSSHGGILKV